MTKDQENNLFNFVRLSLLDVYEKDHYLLSLRPESFSDDHHVGERAIVFRFAHYLQNRLAQDAFFSQFNLDCEYNRNMDHAKYLESINSNVYPDVILHTRGSNDNNLVVMEFKGYWNKDLTHDIEKTIAFTGDWESYRFQLGFVILLGRIQQSVLIKEYKNGSHVQEIHGLESFGAHGMARIMRHDV